MDNAETRGRVKKLEEEDLLRQADELVRQGRHCRG
jgi:hypothetical protein